MLHVAFLKSVRLSSIRRYVAQSTFLYCKHDENGQFVGALGEVSVQIRVGLKCALCVVVISGC